jgi:hypothetical protein
MKFENDSVVLNVSKIVLMAVLFLIADKLKKNPRSRNKILGLYQIQNEFFDQ